MDNRNRIQRNYEFFIGLISLVLSHVASYVFFTTAVKKIEDYSSESWISYGVLVLLSYAILFFCFYSPVNLRKRSRPMEVSSTLRNCTITYAFLSVLLLMTKNEIIRSRYLFVSTFVLYCLLSLVTRYIYKKVTLQRISKSKMATITGVITTCSRGKEFIPKLKTDWSKNVKAVALIDTVYEDGAYRKIRSNTSKNKSKEKGTTVKVGGRIVNDIDGVPVVANSENLMGWIRTASLDEIYINLPAGHESQVNEYIEELEDMGIVVNVNVPSLEKILQQSKFNNLNCEIKADVPVAVFSPTIHDPRQLVLKRVVDIIGGLVGCIISLPIILITAIPLLIESPGPLIFKQQRIGKNGRVFNIYKLRSMYVDAEERKKALMEQNQMDGFMFKMDNDPRITKVGKFIRKTSIDELPQFWNVLKGDMSLVGTRPPTIDEFEQYESHHKRRLSLKPGITGLWQVSGRSNITDFEEVVKLDCEYIDNWSMWLDIKILFKTIVVVFTHKGAE
jgi:exopolysaccharide biosynthesis polyprenyl glycosylphosphotransferase